MSGATGHNAPADPVPREAIPSAKALGKRKMVDPPPSELPYGVFPAPAAEPPMPMPVRLAPDTSADAAIAAALKAEWDEEVRRQWSDRRLPLALQQQQQQRPPPEDLNIDEVWRAANDATYMRELFGDEDDEDPFEGCAIGGGYGTDNTDEIDPDNPFAYDNTQNPAQIREQTDKLNALIETLEKSRATEPALILGSNMPLELPMPMPAVGRRYVGPIKIDPDDLD